MELSIHLHNVYEQFDQIKTLNRKLSTLFFTEKTDNTIPINYSDLLISDFNIHLVKIIENYYLRSFYLKSYFLLEKISVKKFYLLQIVFFIDFQLAQEITLLFYFVNEYYKKYNDLNINQEG